NIVDDSSIPRNDESNIPGTRIEPQSDKESPEVEIAKEKEVEISKEKEVELTNVVIPVNVNDEYEEITDEVYELKRREKGNIVEETRNSPIPTPIRSPRIHTNLVSSDTKKLQELTNNPHTTSSSITMMLWLLVCTSTGEVHAKKVIRYTVLEQQYQLYLAMKVDPQLQQQDIAIWLALQMKFERNTVLQTACRTLVVHLRDHDDPHDDAHPEGENSAKRQKTSEYKAYVSGESSSGQVFQEEQTLSSSGNQEQNDDFDFWTDFYALDDDEIPSKQVSHEIMEEVSLTIDEAKLRKMANEMLRQRCTSGDEHQYHIDQMKNFLKSDIVWESKKEILVSSHPRKTTPLVHSCQRDPEAPALSLINLDLLYLKKGNSRPEKIVLSHHKFPAIIFNDDDIEERTSRWIVARRANDCIVSITEPDYKNLNKNNIEDIYLLIINGNVPDYADTGLLWSLSVFIRSSVIWERVHDFQLRIESYQQKVNLTAPTMTFSGIKDHEMFSIIYEPVHGIIYKNNKKDKRVMRHSEIHKFCDAMLNGVLEETIHVQFDELSKPMAPVQFSTRPTPTFLTPGQISSGLVPNLVSTVPYVPPTNKELEILFQPMFDEYLEPPRVERLVPPALAVQALQSPSSHQGVATGSTIIEDNPFAPVDKVPLVNVFAPEPSSEASSSGDVRSAESTHVTQPHHHLGK
ncbi:hypothetical protein Tco_1227392, partial [Tanacetum coccineum]